MTHALNVVPVLDESAICSVRLANGDTKALNTIRLKDTPIPEQVNDGIEDYRMKIEGHFCLIVLTAASYQWGYTLVWDYVQDKIVHLTNTPFALSATILGSHVVNLYMVQYWGHPADLWYSAVPLELIDPEHEPEKVPLIISPDESVKDSACCEAYQDKGKLFFRAGEQTQCIDKLPNT